MQTWLDDQLLVCAQLVTKHIDYLLPLQLGELLNINNQINWNMVERFLNIFSKVNINKF